MSDEAHEEEQDETAELICDAIAARLRRLADIWGPEETLAYVEKIADQMRDEIAEGV